MAQRDDAEATLQNLIAVAMSDWAISAVPLTSAGLSGSLGSAAIRSQRTRSADCARPGGLAEIAISTNRPTPRLIAMNPAPGRFAMSDAMSAPPAHATSCNFRTAGIGQQAVDQDVAGREKRAPSQPRVECCALWPVGHRAIDGNAYDACQGKRKTDGPVPMPDIWMTAQLYLTALTPFKAFARITTAFAIAFLSSTAIAETTEE